MLLQGLGSFVVWVLYGVIQARRSGTIRQTLATWPRTKKSLTGAGMILGGIILLFLGFMLISSIGGLGKTAMTPFGWILATLFGLGFVHMQTMGMAMLVSVSLDDVTRPTSPPSRTADPASEPRS